MTSSRMKPSHGSSGLRLFVPNQTIYQRYALNVAWAITVPLPFTNRALLTRLPDACTAAIHWPYPLVEA